MSICRGAQGLSRDTQYFSDILPGIAKTMELLSAEKIDLISWTTRTDGLVCRRRRWTLKIGARVSEELLYLSEQTRDIELHRN